MTSGRSPSCHSLLGSHDGLNLALPVLLVAALAVLADNSEGLRICVLALRRSLGGGFCIAHHFLVEGLERRKILPNLGACLCRPVVAESLFSSRRKEIGHVGVNIGDDVRGGRSHRGVVRNLAADHRNGKRRGLAVGVHEALTQYNYGIWL